MEIHGAEPRAALEQAWGIDLPLALGVLEPLLDGAPHRLAELVARSGLSREGVKQLLRLLGLAADGQGTQLRQEEIDAVRSLLVQPSPQTGEARLRQVISAARDDLPAPRRDLDHVPATVDTVVRRALWLTDRFHLPGHRLLVLGDRDLTGLAVATLLPSVDVTVVDVDDTVLKVIGDHARRNGLSITTRFADLRVCVPKEFLDGADLVFTDPPYTPDGIALFARRGLEGLRRSGWARIVICYGSGERQVELSFQVQRALTRLGLMFEAVLPRFNTYDGAEALGSASSLYVCRPTKHAWKQRAADDANPRIYSHGTTALEATSQLPPDLANRLPADALPVGDGWVRQDALPLCGYLATLLGEEPSIRKKAADSNVWVDLTTGFGGHLPRVLLCAPARELTIAAPQESLTTLDAYSNVDRLIRTGHRLDVQRVNATTSLVTRRPEDPGSPAVAELAKRTGAIAVNALREALVAGSRKTDNPLTKNDARTLLGKAELPPATHQARLAELPLTDLDLVARALLDLAPQPAGPGHRADESS